MTDLTTTLRQVGANTYDFFVLPGDFVMSQFAEHAPVVATKLGFVGDEQSAMSSVVVSLLIWILLAVAARKVVSLWQNIVRIVSAMIRTASFRISLAPRKLKMELMCRLRRLFPRQSSGAGAAPEVKLDDLDLAVLQSTAAHGPAFTTSAPELAGEFPLRPTQLQRSLDKLSNSKMLDHATDSTEGYKTYRLSQSGAYFIRLWERQVRARYSPYSLPPQSTELRFKIPKLP